jgi:hypothetical protein
MRRTTMKLNLEPHRHDVCACGDYREDHDDGWCRVCRELVAQGKNGGRPACQRFVLVKREILAGGGRNIE